ncbi:hypothetical protein L842_6115 [Mycobacterium intracellulare MIN_052511_1280]|nr:hypothetical protein L842_6115 [Mycobacterium intracellulare MIN_052511_1280]
MPARRCENGVLTRQALVSSVNGSAGAMTGADEHLVGVKLRAARRTV